MPKYVYNVETREGQLKTGKLYAESEEEARNILMLRGFRIRSIYEVEEPQPKGKK
ncbi:MAG: hypothetical protein AMXMBFR33_44480 [Candidatus Xenobia bacterium]